MKRAALNHPKTHALAAAMGSTRRDALGLLTLLWDFAGQYAPTGTIGRFTNQVIADAVDWTGCPDELAIHLVRTGWIDEVDGQDGRLVIHDWSDHCEQWVRKRLVRDKLSFYSPNNMPLIPSNMDSQFVRPERPAKVDGLPSLAKPTPSLDKRGQKATTPFDIWWAVYPLKVKKDRARAAYVKAAKAVGDAKLIETVQQFRKAVDTWPTSDRIYIPHPTTWLNDGRFHDDPNEWLPGGTRTGQASRTNELFRAQQSQEARQQRHVDDAECVPCPPKQ